MPELRGGGRGVRGHEWEEHVSTGNQWCGRIARAVARSDEDERKEGKKREKAVPQVKT